MYLGILMVASSRNDYIQFQTGRGAIFYDICHILQSYIHQRDLAYMEYRT